MLFLNYTRDTTQNYPPPPPPFKKKIYKYTQTQKQSKFLEQCRAVQVSIKVQPQSLYKLKAHSLIYLLLMPSQFYVCSGPPSEHMEIAHGIFVVVVVVF